MRTRMEGDARRLQETRGTYARCDAAFTLLCFAFELFRAQDTKVCTGRFWTPRRFASIMKRRMDGHILAYLGRILEVKMRCRI